MPLLNISGASGLSKPTLRRLRAKLRLGVACFPQLELESEDDVEVFFVPDLLGEQEEFVIEVREMWKKPKRTKAVQDRLCTILVAIVADVIGDDRRIFAHVAPLFDEKKQGHYLKKPFSESN